MGVLDNIRGLFGGRGRLGIELGSEVTVVELQGDPPRLEHYAVSSHAGYSGAELGQWMERWLDTTDVSAKRAHAVIVDGDIYHYLTAMPEMSDQERHLAAGAELRRQASVPAGQLAHGSTAAGTVTEGGSLRQQVLISAIDRNTLRNAREAVEAAGLEVGSITTVPAALVRAAELLPATPGGQAIAYLRQGRSYLLVFDDGNLRLVRDFMLRGADPDADGSDGAILRELQRSFAYVAQSGDAAPVSHLWLSGALPQLGDLTGRLEESLGIDVDLFEPDFDAGGQLDRFDLAAAAAAIGAAADPEGVADVVPPEEAQESEYRRYLSFGRIAAAVLLALLVAWGAFALASAGWRESRLEQIQAQLAQARPALEQARNTSQERVEHRARRSLLEYRALESTLIAALLQRVGREVPGPLVIQTMNWQSQLGPDGAPYWNAQIQGLVLGSTRSESQAVFNRFFTRLVGDAIVHDVSLVEPLVIGNEEARTPPPITAAIQENLGRGPRRVTSRQRQDDAANTNNLQPGESVVRTTLDELPPFGPTETSVGFRIAVQLKTLPTGDER